MVVALILASVLQPELANDIDLPRDLTVASLGMNTKPLANIQSLAEKVNAKLPTIRGVICVVDPFGPGGKAGLVSLVIITDVGGNSRQPTSHIDSLSTTPYR